MIDDFDKYLEEKREKERIERKKFFDKCASKITDGKFIYHLLGLALCERFKLDLNYNGEPPNVVWNIVNYYVDEINEDYVDWLVRDDAPIIRPISDLKRIFPEIALIKNNENEIIELANRLYGLEIKTDCSGYSTSYFYAYKFDFNSFVPLPIDEIKSIKKEIEILTKYGFNVTELNEKLSEYGLTEDELEMI